MNKKTYAKLIEENIAEMEKYMPEHSLEKKHAIEVLRWSVDALYEGKGILVNLNKAPVMLSLPSDDEIKKMLERPYKAYDDEGELMIDTVQYDLNQYEGAKKIRDYIAGKLGNGA